MGYRRAEEILPMEVIEIIQRYVDGESIYIPKKAENRQAWGSGTRIREAMMVPVRLPHPPKITVMTSSSDLIMLNMDGVK